MSSPFQQPRYHTGRGGRDITGLYLTALECYNAKFKDSHVCEDVTYGGLVLLVAQSAAKLSPPTGGSVGNDQQ